MQSMIGELIEKGHAYVGEDQVVYFSVESFPDYGKLSGNRLDQLVEGKGDRVNADFMALLICNFWRSHKQNGKSK